jgi:glycerophosphoryl diester phosphodiesterase
MVFERHLGERVVVGHVPIPLVRNALGGEAAGAIIPGRTATVSPPRLEGPVSEAARVPIEVPAVIGHRGAAGHAPENTLASFRRARALGARWVEFDVKLTRDGHPILMHDDTLDRTTDGRGPVAEADLADVRRLDAGGWFAPEFRGEPVPTLARALAALAELGLGANVEIKPCRGRERETAAAVAELLKRAWPKELPAPLLSSFREESLAATRDSAPEFPRALLVREVADGWRRRLEDLGCTGFHCEHRRLAEERAREVVAAGFALRCYTVNDRARAATLFGWGVASVFTDYPERILGG